MNLLLSLLFATLLAQQAASLPAGPPPPPEPAAAAPARYLIGSQDLLKVTVFDEPDDNSYRVDGDGYPFPTSTRAGERPHAGGAAGPHPRSAGNRVHQEPQVRIKVSELRPGVLVSGSPPAGQGAWPAP
jgi:protein involved in polysaccharide export with SLBB domain